MSTIIDRIKKELESISPVATVEETGTVVTVGDGVAEIEGIQNARMMELLVPRRVSRERTEMADAAVVGHRRARSARVGKSAGREWIRAA